MSSLPAVTPNTDPLLDTKAFPLLAVQTPPVTASEREIDSPRHTESGPVTVPASGAGFTVSTAVATAELVVAHVDVTVYIIVSTPGDTPSTTPVLDMNAWPFVALQVPPVTKSDKLTDAETHTLVGPVIVPAEALY